MGRHGVDRRGGNSDGGVGRSGNKAGTCVLGGVGWVHKDEGVI